MDLHGLGASLALTAEFCNNGPEPLAHQINGQAAGIDPALLLRSVHPDLRVETVVLEDARHPPDPSRFSHSFIPLPSNVTQPFITTP